MYYLYIGNPLLFQNNIKNYFNDWVIKIPTYIKNADNHTKINKAITMMSTTDNIIMAVHCRLSKNKKKRDIYFEKWIKWKYYHLTYVKLLPLSSWLYPIWIR